MSRIDVDQYLNIKRHDVILSRIENVIDNIHVDVYQTLTIWFLKKHKTSTTSKSVSLPNNSAKPAF